jgi:hypothetical protein
MAKSVKSKKKNVPSNQQVNDSTTSEQPIEHNRKTALSGWPMILGWLAMLIFTFHACTRMVAAGDTWVAMACGRHFVNHGVDTVEPFSANSHKAGPTEEEVKTWPNWAQWITNKVGIKTLRYCPSWVNRLSAKLPPWLRWPSGWHPTGWVDQNWLTHVLFYKLVPKSSYSDGISFTSNALVYWKFAIYVITVICVFYTSRLLGANPALSAVFACFTMFIGRSFLDVRPAGFSNMLVAVFLLVLALTTYRNILYIWLIVPVTVFWSNVHGGYIYVFIMLVPFIGLHLFTNLNRKWTAILYNVTAWPFLIYVLSKASLTMSTLLFTLLLVILDIVLIFYKKNLITIGWKGIYHAIAASFVAFIAVIIFNPFHLTNLTHTFVISVSEHAARWRKIHEWQSAFDWSNPVGTAVPFLVMFIIAWVVLVVWTVELIRTSRMSIRYSKQKTKSIRNYQWPKIDLPMMLIAALTIYMAIRSRRFIPIAAVAGCPIIALLVDQLVRAISAEWNFQKRNSMTVPSMPHFLKLFFIIAGAVAVLFFGTWWGLKFKRIYLNPWPNDPKYSSVFMRMTASDAKPFYAMKFVRDNKLSGKMFNYWTEGGFIAWGQDPDPNTGRTPLRLFMDGRAQAAYNREAFDLWSYIMSGGPVTYQILERTQVRGQEPTIEDYRQIGRWMNQQLTDQNVWLVMMPSAVYNDPDKNNYYYAIRGLEHDPDWPVVFMNNKQKIYVNITTTRGRELFEGIFTGRTVYPDEFHKNLIRAHSWFMYYRTTEQRKEGLEFAIEAFNAKPSTTPMLEIILVASNFAELIPDINEFCTDYINRYNENKDNWSKKDGFRQRVEAARLASFHLEQVARSRGNTELATTYAAQYNDCVNILIGMTQRMKW